MVSCWKPAVVRCDWLGCIDSSLGAELRAADTPPSPCPCCRRRKRRSRDAPAPNTRREVNDKQVTLSLKSQTRRMEDGRLRRLSFRVLRSRHRA
ncbi:hypothetical protein MATL_G00082220 [Megalops atlanticus]|uniref:Uncharacterized protein n=1 Tax=Megalops atlanticus TaxID=7932 RepID=A0A9D3TDN0_MEGAT|nr:hypothetical protein MATL_G00082220 [Megalops atlanticus]